MATRVHLPVTTKSRTYFIDEAGTKGRGGDVFVVGLVRTADPGALHRAVHAVRDRHRFRKEIHFKDLTKGSLPVFREVIDVAAELASFGVLVVDKTSIDLWEDQPGWYGNARASQYLVRRMVSRHEIATILLDEISAPTGVSISDHIRRSVNEYFHCMRIGAAVGLDSTSCDGLQVADLIASSALHYVTGTRDVGLASYLVQNSPKAVLARHVAAAMDIGGFEPCHTPRIRVLHLTTEDLAGIATLNVPMRELKRADAGASGS